MYLFTLLYSAILVVVSRGDLVRPVFTDDTSCTNAPDGSTRECIEILECPVVLDLLRQRNLKLVHEARCGFRSGSPTKVCCPTITHQPDNIIAPDPVICGSSCTCGLGSGFKLIGGENTSIGDWPWAALLHYTGRSVEGFFCGGSLINEQYVLTAAHCFDNKQLTMDFVRLGEYNIRTDIDKVVINGREIRADPPQDIQTEDIIIHPGYQRLSTGVVHNDLALVRLRRRAVLTIYVQPICLSEAIPNINEATIIGWGQQGANAPRSNILQQLHVPIVPVTTCEEAFSSGLTSRIVLDSELHICAGGVEGQDSCKGDSGGPLMYTNAENRFFQLGVVSFGVADCGSSGIPGVYTSIPNHISWIRNQIR